MKKVFLIRVDASEKIGFGHMMRCIALGQFLQDQGCEVHFATIPLKNDLIQSLLAKNFLVHLLPIDFDEEYDVVAVTKIAESIDAHWVVIDGTNLSGNYEALLKNAIFEKKILRIVDQPNEYHCADVLLCQNYGAESMTFNTKPYTKKLLGLQHLLLRREFKEAVKNIKVKTHLLAKKRIMVCMGGSDAASVASQKLAYAISGIKDFDFIFFHETHSKNQVKGVGDSRHNIFYKSFSENIAKEMSRVDFAIVAGGTVMWELIYMRVPFLAVALNEAQESYIKMLSHKGLCVNLGHFLNLTPMVVGKAIEQMTSSHSILDEYRHRYSALLDKNNLELKLIDVLLH